MAKIERVEVLQVDLVPKVKRTDAIQSFARQETPIVRIHTDDGSSAPATATRSAPAARRSSALLARSSRAAPDRPRPGRHRGNLEEPVFRNPRDRGRRDHQPGARRHRHRAVGHPLPAAGRPLWKEAGGAQAAVPVYTTEGGWLHIEPQALVEDALAAQGAGLRRRQDQGRPARMSARTSPASRRCARRSGAGFEIMVDANQAFTVDEAIRRARLYEPLDLAWFEEPLPAEDLGGHVRLSASTSLPIAVGESIYHPSHFREYLQRDACSIVQADVARIGGITPWLKVAHLAETFNVPICPHFLMELHVSLCAAVPNAAWVEYIPQLDTSPPAAWRSRTARPCRRQSPASASHGTGRPSQSCKRSRRSS